MEVILNILVKKKLIWYTVVFFGMMIGLQTCGLWQPKLHFPDCEADELCSFSKTATLSVPVTELKYEESWPDSFFHWDIVDAFLDLDTGEKYNNEQADLYYFYSCGTMCFDTVHIIEGTISKWVGSQLLGFEECALSVLEETTKSQRMGTNEGDVTCFLTDEGRISRLRVDENRTSGGTAELELTITTWEPIVISENPTK